MKTINGITFEILNTYYWPNCVYIVRNVNNHKDVRRISKTGWKQYEFINKAKQTEL